METNQPISAVVLDCSLFFNPDIEYLAGHGSVNGALNYLYLCTWDALCSYVSHDVITEHVVGRCHELIRRHEIEEAILHFDESIVTHARSAYELHNNDYGEALAAMFGVSKFFWQQSIAQHLDYHLLLKRDDTLVAWFTAASVMEIQFGILTNYMMREVQSICGALGMDLAFFDTRRASTRRILSLETLPYPKPTLQAFTAIRRAFPDIPRAEILIVGNSYIHDVWPALHLRLQAALIKDTIHELTIENHLEYVTESGSTYAVDSAGYLMKNSHYGHSQGQRFKFMGFLFPHVGGVPDSIKVRNVRAISFGEGLPFLGKKFRILAMLEQKEKRMLAFYNLEEGGFQDVRPMIRGTAKSPHDLLSSPVVSGTERSYYGLPNLFSLLELF